MNDEVVFCPDPTVWKHWGWGSSPRARSSVLHMHATSSTTARKMQNSTCHRCWLRTAMQSCFSVALLSEPSTPTLGQNCDDAEAESSHYRATERETLRRAWRFTNPMSSSQSESKVQREQATMSRFPQRCGPNLRLSTRAHRWSSLQSVRWPRSH